MATFVHDTKIKSTLSTESLVEQLLPVVGEAHVLFKPEQLAPYECDGLSAYRNRPLAVVLPGTVEEVCEVMRICSEHGVPVVARGAGTGLSGGALPYEHGILLGLSRLNRILTIDADNRLAVVQPGVRNLAISEAVRHLGLYYAPDPSSQIACSIGGNVAENAGGVHCLKYGLTVHNVLGLKIVTVDGELIEAGGPCLDTPGYDLLALITGSEGMLGIVVEVTVRLLARPASARAVLASFDQVETAGDAVSRIISAGILPAGLEMMDNPAIRATEDFVHAGYPVDAAAILICELDGTEDDVDDQIRQVREVLAAEGVTDIRLSGDEAERVRFWSGRKNAFPAVGRISPDYYCIDGTIPRRALGGILREISRLSEEYGLAVANVFHAGDGNLHPLILYDANITGEFERTEALGGRILEACVAAGGTITGEHGVGVEKINQMCVLFPDAELEQFHRVKRAFDPELLLNPGKAVPTLARCAEFNAMHVHAGQVPFPDIERF